MFASKEGTASEGEEAPGAAVLEDIMCFTDYDVASFHTNQSPSHRLSLTSEASIAAVSHQLLHQVCLLATLHANYYHSLDYFGVCRGCNDAGLHTWLSSAVEIRFSKR
jgi:hypothetical protein